ncbi:hypothetical protein ACM66B_007093 [Microbotryomycetes sp. NB124-2]
MSPKSAAKRKQQANVMPTRETPARASKSRRSHVQSYNDDSSSSSSSDSDRMATQSPAHASAAVAASSTASDTDATKLAFALPREGPTTPIQAPVTRVSKLGKLKHEPGTVTDNGQLWTDEIDSALLEGMRVIPNIQRRTIAVDGHELGRNALLSEYVYRKTGWFRSKRQIGSHLQLLRRHNAGNEQVMELLRDHAVTDPTEFTNLAANIHSILGKQHPKPHVPAGFDSVVANRSHPNAGKRKSSDSDESEDEEQNEEPVNRGKSRSPIKKEEPSSSKKAVVAAAKKTGAKSTPAKKQPASTRKRKAAQDQTTTADSARKRTRSTKVEDDDNDVEMNEVEIEWSRASAIGASRRMSLGRSGAAASSSSSLRKSASMGALAAAGKNIKKTDEDKAPLSLPASASKKKASGSRSAPAASPAKSVRRGRGRGRKSNVVSEPEPVDVGAQDEDQDDMTIDTTEAHATARDTEQQDEVAEEPQVGVPESVGWLSQAKKSIKSLFGF